MSEYFILSSQELPNKDETLSEIDFLGGSMQQYDQNITTVSLAFFKKQIFGYWMKEYKHFKHNLAFWIV